MQSLVNVNCCRVADFCFCTCLSYRVFSCPKPQHKEPFLQWQPRLRKKLPSRMDLQVLHCLQNHVTPSVTSLLTCSCIGAPLHLNNYVYYIFNYNKYSMYESNLAQVLLPASTLCWRRYSIIFSVPPNIIGPISNRNMVNKILQKSTAKLNCEFLHMRSV